MYQAWIEYIDSNNENKKKFVGEIVDLEDLAKKVFLDEYINEYLFMPEAILVIKDKKRILNKYIVKEEDGRTLLISIIKLKELFDYE